jgi:plasmid stability protein
MCRGRREGVGNLTVRNLDDWVIEGLKAEAKTNERSLEGEVRHVLTQRVGRRKRIADFRERTRQIAAMTADTPQTDSLTLLREDRDR